MKNDTINGWKMAHGQEGQCEHGCMKELLLVLTFALLVVSKATDSQQHIQCIAVQHWVSAQEKPSKSEILDSGRQDVHSLDSNGNTINYLSCLGFSKARGPRQSHSRETRYMLMIADSSQKRQLRMKYTGHSEALSPIPRKFPQESSLHRHLLNSL